MSASILCRLYVAPPLTRGQIRILPKASAHYVRTVLRAQSGDALALFDGMCGEWHGQIIRIDRRAVEIEVHHCSRTQSNLADIWLCVAPIKKMRLDYLAQKATEMGVGRFQPTITTRTQTRRLNLDRLRANAIEAAEQCGLLSIPEIMPPQNLDSLLRNWSDIAPQRKLVYCDEAAAGVPDITALRALHGNAFALLVGPEGGFTPAERMALRRHAHTQPLVLGPRILRTDTAIVAALALLQTHAGDWGAI